MIAKAGALRTIRRRSQSPSRPVRSAWSGAGRSGARSMSCSWPSVTRMAPASRARGSSAIASASAAMRSDPPSPSASPMRTTRSSVLGSAAISASMAASASAVWPARSEMFWLALSSITAMTMSDSGSRSSVWSEGLASAARSAVSAKPRSHQPDRPRQRATATKIKAMVAAAQRTGIARSGSKTMVLFIYCPSLSRSAGTCTWSDL
jgi:hypothetical protein